MPAIHIHAHVESDTLHLPELLPLIGKDVDIIVYEKEDGGSRHERLKAFLQTAGSIDIDADAIASLREASRL